MKRPDTLMPDLVTHADGCWYQPNHLLLPMNTFGCQVVRWWVRQDARGIFTSS